MDDFMLTDEHWLAVDPLLPRSTATTGRPMADRRRMLEGMLFQLTTGCQWRHLPRERFGPHQTVYHHFNRWRKLGVFERLVETLRKHADDVGRIDWSLLCADGTNVRAAASASGGRLSPRPKNPVTTRWAVPAADSAANCTC